MLRLRHCVTPISILDLYYSGCRWLQYTAYRKDPTGAWERTEQIEPSSRDRAGTLFPHAQLLRLLVHLAFGQQRGGNHDLHLLHFLEVLCP